MSRLRPECSTHCSSDALPDDTVLFMLRDSVARRKALIFGKLRDGKGGTCAMGAFWDDNPGAIVHTYLVDEVAAVNDSVPQTATPQERWKKVNSWIRWKLRLLANQNATK